MIDYNPYQKKKPFNKTIIVILLVILLAFAAARNLLGVRNVLQSAVYPFQYVTVSLWKGITGIPSTVVNIRSLSEQNAKLEEELKALKTKAAITDELINDNKRLKFALGFKQDNWRFKLMAARVIGRSPTPWFSRLEVNQGIRAGVEKNMPVINEDGLVGKVVEVSAFSSVIMLLKDVDSSVAAVDARSRDFGVAEGGASHKLVMRYVSAGGDVTAGDKIVTSQISTLYPAGITIGTVTQASKREHDLFYQIDIKPAVDFSKLEEVYIVF